MDRFTTIGIDIGGTKIAAGVVSFPEGRVCISRIIPTAITRGGEAILSDVIALAATLLAEAGAMGLKVRGIGVGLCEIVDIDGNIRSENCIPWRELPVRQRLEKLAPVVIDADVRVAACAEALFGAGKSFRIFLYVTVGTGISSCLMLDGKPFLGARGATGTMASSPLHSICSQCGTVSDRTLEEMASGPALVARYNKKAKTQVETGEAVLAAAGNGDPTAIEVVQSAGEALGQTLGLLVGVLDPEAIIIGGGLGLSGGLYWKNLIDSTRRHIWSPVHRDLPILPAAMGRETGVVGAAAVAWEKFRAADS